MSSLFQNAYYLAINFNAILYGTELVLYVLLVLITIYMSTEAVFGQEMWIVHADFPGGAPGFLAENASIWYQTMGTTASVILNLFADALLIYRMYVVWTDYRIIAFPCVLYAATIALGIVELYGSGKPDADFFVGMAVQLGISYYTSTISLNIIATGVICGRLIYLGRAIATAQNVQERGKDTSRYTGTLSVIIESALPYSMAGFAFLVSYGLGSDIAIMFGALYGMFTCISPQLIILRAVTGSAWTKDNTAQSVSAWEFANLGPSSGPTITAAEPSEVVSTVDHKSIQETV